MTFEHTFISEAEHFIVDPAWVAYTHDRYAAVGQLFGNPVYGHVALGTDQNLAFTTERFVNGFYKCSGFSGTRRTVYNGYVFSPQYVVDRRFLLRVQPWKTDGHELIGSCSDLSQKDFP